MKKHGCTVLSHGATGGELHLSLLPASNPKHQGMVRLGPHSCIAFHKMQWWFTLSPISMEVENGGVEDDWLVSFWGPFSTSRVMGGRGGHFFQTGLLVIPSIGISESEKDCRTTGKSRL